MVPLCLRAFISIGPNEKKAISDPETMAEKNNKMKRINKPIRASKLKGFNSELRMIIDSL
jgi:hypothetical protein